jgi:hypothetical protein
MSLLTSLRAADEAYLVALANKGIYNRALRELPEAGVTFVLAGEEVRGSFADGTTCSLQGALNKYTCSCPSRTLCKHALMVILAVQQSSDTVTEEESAEPAESLASPDFSAVSEVKRPALEKLSGKKTLSAAQSALLFATEKTQITEQSVLTVTLLESGMVVRFLPGMPLDTATCSCKAPSFCLHRTLAVLAYIVEKKGALPEEFRPATDAEELEFGTVTLGHIESFVTTILSCGLARLPDDSSDRFLHITAICHSQRLANLERLATRISGQLAYFRARSAFFQRDYLLEDLVEMLRLTEAIKKGDHSRRTVGVFRDTYNPVRNLELWGLGAFGWESVGGYTGVTTLFYEPGEKRILRYSASMPKDVGKSSASLYKGQGPWGLGRLAGLSRSHFYLRGGKRNASGGLSATEEGRGEFIGPAFFAAEEVQPLLYDDFQALLAAYWEFMGAETSGDRFYALIRPERLESSSFDRIEQIYSLPLLDINGCTLSLQVQFSEANRLLLENLARLEEVLASDEPGVFLVSVMLTEGKLSAYPVTHSGVTKKALKQNNWEHWNLSLEKMLEKKEKSSYRWDKP